MSLRTLTVVIPVHNEAPNLRPLVDRLCAVAGKLPGWELVLLVVDDGSTDRTIAI
jgi:glycosyltransferase involved in cell wall biosynthesis